MPHPRHRLVPLSPLVRIGGLSLSRRDALRIAGGGLLAAGLTGCFPTDDSGGPIVVEGDGGTGGGDGGLSDGGATDGGPVDAGTPDAGSSDAGSICDPNRDVCIDLSDPRNSVLTEIDGWGILDIGSDRIVIVRTGAADFTVDSSICTHQGCDVEYRASGPDLFCRCHGSDFALDGSVLQGPARTPLRAYLWDFDGVVLAIHV